MNLRPKTLSIIGGTLTATVLILYFISHTVVVGGFSRVEEELLSSFAKIENADTGQSVQQVSDALKLRIKTLETRFSDWSQWDDTYRFMVDKNDAYLKSNLTTEGVAALKVNLMLLLDTEGNRVFETGFDLETGKCVPVPAGLEPHLTPGGRLLHLPTPTSAVSGILRLPEGVLMIASRPIVRTDGTGPIRGTLVCGRYLDTAEFQQLADVTHLTIEKHGIDDPGLPSDFATFKATLGPGVPFLVRPRSGEIVSGYTAYPDIFGAPALLLRVDVPRNIYRQGLATQRAIQERGRVVLLSLVISILATGFALAGAIHYALESLVLSRLATLNKQAGEIGARGNFSGRVDARGKDEIARLAGSVNRMLDALASAHWSIESRNAEMGLLMDTVPSGLLSLDEDLRVNPEYSRSAARMLAGSELKGRRYTELLGLVNGRTAEGEELNEFLGFVRDDCLPEESLSPLNPYKELRISHGSDRWLRLSYRAIRRGNGVPNHVLVVLEDITEATTLAEQVARSQSENLQLKAMVEDPELFREFLAESHQNLRDAQSLAPRLGGPPSNRPVAEEVFRLIHTIKGGAGTFGLGQVSEAASKLEDELEALRTDDGVSHRAVQDVRESLTRLSEVFVAAADTAARILGDDVGGETSVQVRVSSDQLRQYIEEIRGITVDASHESSSIELLKEEMIRRLQTIRSVPAHRGLARSIKTVPALIERLGKEVEFRFVGRDTPLDCELAHELNTPLVHLFRNAFDHGIEEPEERLASGKPPQGTVALEVTREDGKITVAVVDDGRGIDPEKLKATSIERGILSPDEAGNLSPEETLRLIFRPGFSTAEEVTHVSGRGVGMAAVLASVRSKLGGDISIDSVPGRGTHLAITLTD